MQGKRFVESGMDARRKTVLDAPRVFRCRRRGVRRQAGRK